MIVGILGDAPPILLFIRDGPDRHPARLIPLLTFFVAVSIPLLALPFALSAPPRLFRFSSSASSPIAFFVRPFALSIFPAICLTPSLLGFRSVCCLLDHDCDSADFFAQRSHSLGGGGDVEAAGPP